MTDISRNIEEALAHQDRQIQDLSDMVLRQWNEIDALKKTMMRLQAKVDGIEESISMENNEGLSVTEQAARDKPPHY